MTAVPPRPAAPERGAWVCERCGKAPEQHAAGGDADACVYAPAFVVQGHAAPDATAGDGLREVRDAVALWLLDTFTACYESDACSERRDADALIAGPLRDVLAAATRDRAAVARVREVHAPDDTEPHACTECGEAWPCCTTQALDDTL